MKALKISSHLVEILGADGKPRTALHFSPNELILKNIEDSSVHAVIQDEPYGLNPKKDDVEQLARSILAGNDFIKGGSGFDGADWDSDVPPLSHRKELYRILKPGGYALCMTSTRTAHLAMLGLVGAGFRIIDQLGWLHTQGSPKGADFDQKLIDQDLEKYLEHRSGLRPVMEIAILAQKPIDQANAIENLRIHGTGLLNIGEAYFIDQKNHLKYPANIILSDEFHKIISAKAKLSGIQSIEHNMPLQILPFQKPTLKEKDQWTEGLEKIITQHYFTKKDVEAKANHHPTVKPLDLMRHLVRLLTRKDDLVVDAYMGSGSTSRACLIEGRKFIGVDFKKEYFEISKATTINLYREIENHDLKAERTKLSLAHFDKIKNAPAETKSQLIRDYLIKTQSLKNWEDYINQLKAA